jgi:hypothetical protein
MGRPKKDEDEKKIQLNIRVKPTTKLEIANHAQDAGCTVSMKAEQLIEDMLNLSDDADPQTIELLADIVGEIKTVESLTGHRWHEDLKTWAAVSEIFKGDPMRKKMPTSSHDDPAVKSAWAAYTDAIRETKSLIAMMEKLGVSISEEPIFKYNDLMPGPRGIFGRKRKEPIDLRAIERSRIAEIEDQQQRQRAELIFGMILEADEQSKKAYSDWQEATAPYLTEEAEGRRIYKEHRRKMVLADLDKGKIPHIRDFLDYGS